MSVRVLFNLLKELVKKIRCEALPNFLSVFSQRVSIGESQSICPFLKNNGDVTPKGPSPIIFQVWTDKRTFSDLKYT